MGLQIVAQCAVESAVYMVDIFRRAGGRGPFAFR